MIEWLLASIDASRVHDVGFEVSWHGRLMVFAWSVVIPLGVISARFFKILPNQDWPRVVDSQVWWATHLVLQYASGVLMVIAVWMIWSVSGTRDGAFFHHFMGWTTVTLCGVQYLAGWLRGSKGGPTEVQRTGTIRGDHFDMTPRRQAFERLHKTVGYISLFVAFCAVVSGMWLANAPRWMCIGLFFWWCAVIAFFVRMQKTRGAVETYEAIWGPDKNLPGNQMKPIGWGIKRRGPP